jgi:hypothetical protein
MYIYIYFWSQSYDRELQRRRCKVYNGSSSLSRFKSKKNVSFPLLKNALAQRCRRLERSFKVEENICFQNALATRGVVNHDCRIGSWTRHWCCVRFEPSTFFPFGRCASHQTYLLFFMLVALTCDQQPDSPRIKNNLRWWWSVGSNRLISVFRSAMFSKFCGWFSWLLSNGNLVRSWQQGCQMVCFQTKNPNLGKIWRALE